VSGNQGVMPNPDDILPKQAWTDFSGTDEWPNLIADEKDLQVERTGRSKRGKKVREQETEPEVGNNSSEVYVNVDRPRTPPKPKERRLGPKPSLEDRSPEERVEELVYESLVDDDDDGAHFVRKNSITTNGEMVTNDQIESKKEKSLQLLLDTKTSPSPLQEKEEKLIFSAEQEDTFSRPPPTTQTFRSTKFISVTNSPKSKSPLKSPTPLDR
jgi:hypothetical protein